jgi:signal transduction histidine kinase
MASSFAKVTARINAAVDWFIPQKLLAERDLLPGVRMFLFSHLFGPFLGHTISLSMLYLQGGADVSWWIFFAAVTAFWPFPLVLRLTGWYVPLSLVSIENLLFCIFWGCYQYGGASSPILPWLVTVPLLAFFYLPGRATRIVVGLQIVLNLAVFYAIYNMLGFPNKIAPVGLIALGMISTLCAGIYVSMMALYYGNVVSSQAELEQEIKRHKETERQLIGATEQIGRAMRAKAEFLAKMSHELRNPLNSIIGYSEILIEGVDASNEQTHKDLNSIREAGQRLLELINDLLDLSRLEAGKMDLRVEEFRLNAFMDTKIGKWRRHIERNGNKLVVDPAPDVALKVDETVFGRVVESILNNAGKFSKNGEVTVSTAVIGDQISISIADTGPGIAPEQIGKLFESFGSTGEETASNYGADVRLGLPLAYRFCRLMGGDISVESVLGCGSTFTVTVPRCLPGAEVADTPALQAAA